MTHEKSEAILFRDNDDRKGDSGTITDGDKRLRELYAVSAVKNNQCVICQYREPLFVMFILIIQFLEITSFLVLLALLWMVGKKPGWRMRVIIYGWALSILWGLLWCAFIPILLNNFLDKKTLQAAFPDGTLVMGLLVSGWVWPVLIVGIIKIRERKQNNAAINGKAPPKE